jgi:Family of unknown function (DUF6812)
LALQLSPRPNDCLESNGKLKQVKVFVCTEICTLDGYTYCMSHHRLLDTLNQNVVANSVPVGKDFLPLMQVEVSFPNGENQTTAEANVRKSNILFVGENNDGQATIPENKDRQLAYRMKPKTALSAEIHLPLYNLKGQIYGESWQQILDVVDRADRFIALTNAEVFRKSDKAVLTFDFVAVNRDKIIYIGEPANSAELSLPIN